MHPHGPTFAARSEVGVLPMGIAKKAIRGATALSVAATTWLMGTGVAGADEFYEKGVTKDHTFRNGAGETVTCTVSARSTLFRATGAPEFEGTAFTDAFGFHESCSSTFVGVLASYRDVQGRDRRVSADSIDGDVFLFVDNVRSNYRVTHTAFFFDCSENCEFTVTTAPK
jgi:hypothetical protein